MIHQRSFWLWDASHPAIDQIHHSATATGYSTSRGGRIKHPESRTQSRPLTPNHAQSLHRCLEVSPPIRDTAMFQESVVDTRLVSTTHSFPRALWSNEEFKAVSPKWWCARCVSTAWCALDKEGGRQRSHPTPEKPNSAMAVAPVQRRLATSHVRAAAAAAATGY